MPVAAAKGRYIPGSTMSSYVIGQKKLSGAAAMATVSVNQISKKLHKQTKVEIVFLLTFNSTSAKVR